MGKYSRALFEKMPVVGIMRHLSLDLISQIMPFYIRAGFTNLEITMNSANASALIEDLTKEYPDLNIGAGTVCTMEDLEWALKAGASFIVTPVLDLEVMNYCKKHEVPIMPGAFTPLEIYTAWKEGAEVVKIFPATQLGPGYVKDILAPLSRVKVLPTGGVSVDNIAEFFEAGATGVGMGTSLFDKTLIDSKDFDGLMDHFMEIAKRVKRVQRSGNQVSR